MWPAAAAPGLAVEKAMKMSPEPLPEMLPLRPRPRETRRARRFNWCETSGASVATTTMMEPRSNSLNDVEAYAGSSGISLPTGTPAMKIFARAVVALHKDADRVGADFRFDLSRRRTDAAFEFVADHSGATADVAFFDSAAACGIDRVEGVFRFDVEAVDIVEPAIPSFGDDGERPPVARGIGLAVGDAPLNDGIAHDADAVRVGDHHGTFQKTGLFHPRGAGHFAIAVERPPTGENGIVHRVFSARKYGGYSRSNRSITHLKFSFTRHERGVPDGHAGNVGDGVERAGRAVKRDTEIAGAGLGRRSRLSRGPRNRRKRAKKNGESAKIIWTNHSLFFSQEDCAERNNSVFFCTAFSSSAACCAANFQSCFSTASVSPGNSKCA